jgi:hypothetical protein
VNSEKVGACHFIPFSMAILEPQLDLPIPFVIPVPFHGSDLRYVPSERPISVELPRHHYDTVKTIPVPFDARLSNNGKFNKLEDALLYICRHCQFHHGRFTRPLARLYLGYCRLLDLEEGAYVRLGPLSKRVFEREFEQVVDFVGLGEEL